MGWLVGGIAMTWYPWVKSPAYSAMPQAEFIEWLRYRAIDFGMPPAFINCIDDLQDNSQLPDEIEKLESEKEELEDKLEEAERKLYMAKSLREAKRK